MQLLVQIFLKDVHNGPCPHQAIEFYAHKNICSNVLGILQYRNFKSGTDRLQYLVP